MLRWLATTRPKPTDTLPDRLTLAGTEVPLVWSRHHNARRMTLRYDAQRRQVRLTLPTRAPLRLAHAFLHEKEHWLAMQLRSHPPATPFADGAALPVLGETLTLHHHEGLRGRVERRGDALHATCHADALPKRVEGWLKAQLREAIVEEASRMAAQAGVRFKRITVRDTSSRWGSCSSEGNLSFCWRLVFAPREILSYLIAHEVAHLREMNHSPAFWRIVAQLYPDYKRAKKWLKDNAAELHRYGAA